MSKKKEGTSEVGEVSLTTSDGLKLKMQKVDGGVSLSLKGPLKSLVCKLSDNQIKTVKEYLAGK